MGKQWPTRSFKSGNSVAIRVPAALGVEPGKDWVVEKRDDEFVLRPKDAPKRKFNVAKVAGSAAGLNYIKDEDRILEERPLRWPGHKVGAEDGGA